VLEPPVVPPVALTEPPVAAPPVLAALPPVAVAPPVVCWPPEPLELGSLSEPQEDNRARAMKVERPIRAALLVMKLLELRID
jgi:hypothetical protein